jgi:hypothetical protein
LSRSSIPRGIGERFRTFSGIAPLVLIPLGAVVLRLLYGDGTVGYDAAYALAWGNDLAELRVPELRGPATPTPHPLPNLLGAVLSPLGESALVVTEAIAWLSLAALGWFAFRLAQASFLAATGVVLAAILLTRQQMVFATYQTLVDIPFLALLLAAAAIEVRRPKAGAPVFALLAIAGLLRPETWLIALAYGAYVAHARPRERWLRTAVAAAAGPALWLTADLLVTGDPLFSLHGTQDFAARLERPVGFGTAVDTAPKYIEALLGAPIAIGGLVGALAATRLMPRRAAIPTALVALGTASYLLLGLADLPLLSRYLLAPTVMIAFFAAAALTGWSVGEPRRVRLAWAAGAAVLAVFVLAEAPQDADRLEDIRSFTDTRLELEDELHDLVFADAARPFLRDCEPQIYIPSALPVPLVTFWLDRPTGTVEPLQEPVPPDDAVVIAPAADAARGYILDPREGSVRGFTPPRGFRRVEANASFALYAGPGSRAKVC